MNTALAIAGVTAVLRDVLTSGLVEQNASAAIGSSVVVTALPLDRIALGDGGETSQLNLFLHQVTPNLALRSRAPAGEEVARIHPESTLALDLHYLISAYGNADLHGEILLGYAIQSLHDHPVISRETIRRALRRSPDRGAPLPPALRALADSGLEEKLEPLRVTPKYLSSEEMSKIWTASHAAYRPSATYEVSVALIRSTSSTQ